VFKLSGGDDAVLRRSCASDALIEVGGFVNH
jgi:hypothetical protein